MLLRRMIRKSCFSACGTPICKTSYPAHELTYLSALSLQPVMGLLKTELGRAAGAHSVALDFAVIRIETPAFNAAALVRAACISLPCRLLLYRLANIIHPHCRFYETAQGIIGQSKFGFHAKVAVQL